MDKRVIIFLVSLLIFIVLLVCILLIGNKKNITDVQEIKNDSSLTLNDKIKEESNSESVIINNYIIQNENLLDNFIERQDDKNNNDMELKFQIDGKSISLKLIKNGKDEPIIKNEGIYWYYIVSQEGKEEKKFPAFEYNVGRRVEDIDGGMVIVSILIRDQDMGAIYPVDICRYSLKGSNYSE